MLRSAQMEELSCDPEFAPGLVKLLSANLRDVKKTLEAARKVKLRKLLCWQYDTETLTMNCLIGQCGPAGQGKRA